MKCEQILEQLSLYLDGELPADESKAVQKHLKTCPECAALFFSMKEMHASLSDFPEIEFSSHLKKKLYAVPGKKEKKPFFRLDFLTRPALQPILGAASLLLILFSLYTTYPNRASLNKTVDRQLHLGIKKVEKLYAGAESITASLGQYKENVLYSLKNINVFGRGNEDTIDNNMEE